MQQDLCAFRRGFAKSHINGCLILVCFLMRGLANAKEEFELWDLTNNLLKFYRHDGPAGKPGQGVHPLSNALRSGSVTDL